MRTETYEFEAVWGKKPRGTGYWCLIVNGFDEAGDLKSQRYFESGTVMEAKKRACHKFKAEHGVSKIDTVKVMP